MGNTYKTASQALNKALRDDKDSFQTIERPPDEFPEIKKIIEEDDTPEQVTEESTPCQEVLIQAHKNNTSAIYIGPETVDEDSYALEAGNSLTVCISDVSLIYVFGKIGNKAVVLYTNHSTEEE